MSRRPARCTEADLARAIRAADRASAPRAVMLDAAGRIWILPAKDAPERPEKAAPPPIDDDWSMVE
jgi:hypothetical protein